jgi:hypothetical protein
MKKLTTEEELSKSRWWWKRTRFLFPCNSYDPNPHEISQWKDGLEQTAFEYGLVRRICKTRELQGQRNVSVSWRWIELLDIAEIKIKQKNTLASKEVERQPSSPKPPACVRKPGPIFSVRFSAKSEGRLKWAISNTAENPACWC